MIIRSFVGTRNFVWSEDPSLDKEKWDAEQFRLTGDLKFMPAIDGGTVTVFEIAPLRMEWFIKTMALDGLERFKEAVAYGLKAVRNYTCADGQPLELKTTKVDGGERLSKATLEALFEPMLFVEMGDRILELSRLHPPKGSR